MTRPPVRIRAFVRIAADLIDVEPSVIIGPTQTPPIVAARRLGMAMAARHGHPPSVIARVFGRHRQTVSQAIRWAGQP